MLILFVAIRAEKVDRSRPKIDGAVCSLCFSAWLPSSTM